MAPSLTNTAHDTAGSNPRDQEKLRQGFNFLLAKLSTSLWFEQYQTRLGVFLIWLFENPTILDKNRQPSDKSKGGQSTIKGSNNTVCQIGTENKSEIVGNQNNTTQYGRTNDSKVLPHDSQSSAITSLPPFCILNLSCQVGGGNKSEIRGSKNCAAQQGFSNTSLMVGYGSLTGHQGAACKSEVREDGNIEYYGSEGAYQSRRTGEWVGEGNVHNDDGAPNDGRKRSMLWLVKEFVTGALDPSR